LSHFHIRPAVRRDTPLILRFIRQLADYEQLADEVVATQEVLEAWIFDQKKAEVLIGEEDEKPVGFVLFFHNFSTFLGRAGIYIEDLFVIPEARGRGYGKALIKYLAGLCIERGCGRLEWACLDWNKASIAFYLSLGAAPMEAWTTYRLAGEQLKKISE
jgi:GNAT superfamily N-acetyltransferase